MRAEILGEKEVHRKQPGVAGLDRINGAVAVDLQITVDGDGIPRIVSMKQKTLRKDKGTMQKR